MAYRPGFLVTSRATPPARGRSVESGTWFVVGAAEKGSVVEPQLVRNLTEFRQIYGSRQPSSLLWDALDTAFHEGVTEAYVSRVIGSSGAIASVTLNDAAGSPQPSLKVSAANPGVWGNGISVAVVVTNGQFVLVVTQGGVEVDRSVSCADQSSAINWSQQSDWIRVSLPNSAGQLIPAAASATALTGGVDDYNGITDTDRINALNRITHDYGVGQVSVPGSTASTVRTALFAHAAANNREALLDVSDSPSRSALVTEGSGLQGNEYGALFAPWVQIPGIQSNTIRIAPPCGLVAGLMARSDALNSPNVPAAAENGIARYVLGLTQAPWSDSDRDLLNSASVNVIRPLRGAIQLYGYRTLANPLVDASWIELGNQRLRNVISGEGEVIASRYVLVQVDGSQQKIAQFQGDLKAMLLKYYLQGSLYGTKPDEAFFVDVGPEVNTPETLANGELHAVLSVRMSPSAELVVIEIAKVPITQQL